MTIELYERVRLSGSLNEQYGLRNEDRGYVIEIYADGNVEVEFSNPDGSTKSQIVVPEDALIPCPESEPDK